MATTKKPNILVIFGDDISVTNLSCYSDGIMGDDMPNVDRLAKEGMKFLHYYGEQSCTAAARHFSPASMAFGRASPKWNSLVRQWG